MFICGHVFESTFEKVTKISSWRFWPLYYPLVHKQIAISNDKYFMNDTSFSISKVWIISLILFFYHQSSPWIFENDIDLMGLSFVVKFNVSECKIKMKMKDTILPWRDSWSQYKLGAISGVNHLHSQNYTYTQLLSSTPPPTQILLVFFNINW